MTITIAVALNAGQIGMEMDLTDLGLKEPESYTIFLSDEEIDNLEKFGENRLKETAALLLKKGLWAMQARFFQVVQNPEIKARM